MLHSKKLSIILIGLPFSVLLALAAIWAFQLTTSSTATSGSRIIYLVPERSSSLENLPGSFSELRSKGFTLVHSFRELQRSFTEQTRAILVDAAMADQVDRAWLNQRYRNAIVVGGINIPFPELLTLVGEDRSDLCEEVEGSASCLFDGFFHNDWEENGLNFLSMVFRRDLLNGRSAGGLYQPLYSLNMLVGFVESKITASQAPFINITD